MAGCLLRVALREAISLLRSYQLGKSTGATNIQMPVIHTKSSDFIQTTKFRKYLVVIGVIQIGTFHAYMLYYLRIAQIRNGRFLAEVLSDIMRKKSATLELE